MLFRSHAGGDGDRPEGELVPRQEVASEPAGDDAQEERHPHQPVPLARREVAAPVEDAKEVEEGDQDQAVGEIARVLRLQGDFVCQTTLGPRRPPLWIRMADRILKFGYFYLDDLKDRLYRFNFDLQVEERSNINYIFRK